jgi:hypothetical protein
MNPAPTLHPTRTPVDSSRRGTPICAGLPEILCRSSVRTALKYLLERTDVIGTNLEYDITDRTNLGFMYLNLLNSRRVRRDGLNVFNFSNPKSELMQDIDE